MTDLSNIEILDCPACQGPGVLEEENGWMYVICMDCGCHTAEVEFRSEADKADAAARAAHLWNTGKAISSAPGE